MEMSGLTVWTASRISEEILQESIESRTEQLISLRELGPPDLVHLLKQPVRGGSKQVFIAAAPLGIVFTKRCLTSMASITMLPASMRLRLPA